VTSRYDLDHVALAAADTAPALRFLTTELGGTVIFGGQSVGFRPMQVWLGSPDGDGMPVELLEPWDVERNNFLARFVERHGAGPHHLTFKVPDLVAALERIRAAGYKPTQLDLSDPEWKEAFLLPREANGTVVQLAESHGHPETRAELLAHVAANGANAHPQWWADPVLANGTRATLRRVVLRTPRLDSGIALFAGLLLGDIEREAGDAVDLVWPRGGRLRLIERPNDAPGIDRLEVEGLSGARVEAGTQFVPATSIRVDAT
jgi:catechol 2,3-dioxygenase-like lactoylglutathione lyase family enzyme